MQKRLLAILMTMVLLLTLIGPVDVAQAATTYDLSAGALVLDSGSENYTITGSYSGLGPAITVSSGFTGSITLDGVNINPSSGQGLQLNAPVVLNLVNSNTVTGVLADAIAVNSRVTIQGAGSLTCNGGNGADSASPMGSPGAGESGFDIAPESTLIIKSGTITANGGNGGSGAMLDGGDGGAAIKLQYSGAALIVEGGTLNLTSGLVGTGGFNKGSCINSWSCEIRIYGGTINMNPNGGVGLNATNGKMAIANAQVNVTGASGSSEYGLSFSGCKVPIINSSITLTNLYYGIYANNASLEVMNSTINDGSNVNQALYFGPNLNTYINIVTGSAISFSGTDYLMGFTSYPKVYIKGSFSSSGTINYYGMNMEDYVYPADFNSAPYAEVRAISGEATVGSVLSANYQYWDAEEDAESGSIIKWYRCDAATGSSGVTEVATSSTYTLTSDDHGKYIYFTINPKAATGANSDYTLASMRIGPITNTASTAPPIAAPTNLVLTNTTSGQVGITYTASPSAQKYLILRGTGSAPTLVPVDGSEYSVGDVSGGTVIYSGSATTYTDTSATAGSQYFYKVYAYNGAGTDTAYYSGQALEGSLIEKSGSGGVSTVINTDKPTTVSYPEAGVRVNFPGGTNTTLTVTKNTTAPESNFYGNLPNGRKPVSLYYTVTSSNASPGTYNIVLDFSSFVTTQTAAESFKLMKRPSANDPWLDISSYITNRQTDGVWGKFTVSGLTGFSQFAGYEPAITHTVISAADSGAGSLRATLSNAQSGDIIQFDTSVMNSNTVTLTSPLNVSKDITIIGADNGIILDGNNTSQIMTIDTGVTASLSNLKLQNGNDASNMVGGIYNGGTLYLTNCVVAGNRATGTYQAGAYTYGGVGGILQDSADTKLYIINSTIADNMGATTDDGAGGVLVADGYVELYNSIIYGNEGQYRNVYLCTTTGGTVSYYSLYEDADAYYSGSLYTGNNAFITGSNNIYDQNPAFVSSGSDPYLIYGKSPCVDTGSNTYIAALKDIRGTGYDRQLNKTNAASGTVDMGAYEYKQGSDALEPTFTVSFQVNGGSIVDSQSVAYNAKATRPTTDPTKAGYTFGGWYADSTLATAFDFTNTSITQATAIYAKWTAVVPSVTPSAPQSTPGSVENGNQGNKDTTQTVRKVTVKSSDEKGNGVSTTVPVVRDTKDNKKVDRILLDQDMTKEVLNKMAEQKQNTVQLVVDDVPKDEADEVIVTVSHNSVQNISGNQVALDVITDEVAIGLSKEAMREISKEEKELYFRVVPLRAGTQRSEAIQNAITAKVVLEEAGNSTVQTLGIPMTIETNYTNINTKLTFSLKDIAIPTEKALRDKFINSLGVYINHSDGSQELSKGRVIYDKAGNPIGFEIEINKFSTFTIVSISNQAPAASDLKLTGKASVGSNLRLKYTYHDMEQDVQGDSIIRWYRADNKGGKNMVMVSEGTLSYKVSSKDRGKYILVKVTPIAKTGELIGEASSTSIKVPAKKEKEVTIATEPVYNSHVKLGVIKSKNYADKVAKLFEKNYKASNVAVKKVGKYYNITMDFVDKTAAKQACKDMKKKRYIVNYSID